MKMKNNQTTSRKFTSKASAVSFVNKMKEQGRFIKIIFTNHEPLCDYNYRVVYFKKENNDNS